jgi:transcriptional regulator with XRE-family HTH domain
MVRLTEIIIKRILLLVFSKSISQTQLAEQYHLSQSTINNLVNQSENYVNSLISRINADQQKLANYLNNQLPAMLQQVIWIDETFFKVGRKSWALILIIDYNRRILGWHWVINGDLLKSRMS